MKRAELIAQIQSKGSFLCVGLDTDLKKIPQHLLKEEDPIFAFNREIIDATVEHCVAYKPNTAFYEVLGSKGWESLEKTLAYIPDTHFKIADAKRGDIGNTAKMYAGAFYGHMNADAVTVAPYMGKDSVQPFLGQEGRWAVILALTSNPSSEDFQQQQLDGDGLLYEKVLATSMAWGTAEDTMYVVGSTKAESMSQIRATVPDHFLLVPGVGAQGGDLQSVAQYGMNADCGLLVNSSRGIIYAGKGENFAEVAKGKAAELHEEMKGLIDLYMK
jgi:orotidine-5'-phosphate decarboxylase